MAIDDLTQAMLILAGYYEPAYIEGAKNEYGCVMAILPQEIGQRIMQWGIGSVPEMELYQDRSEPYYNHGREYDIHVTVKYGLHTNNPLDVARLIQANRISPFEILLGKIGVFEENEDFDVVMVEVESEPLTTLNALISNSIDVTDTHPVYHPHVTIAYVLKGMGRAHVDERPFEGLTVFLDRLTFSSRDGRKTVIPLYGVEL